MTLDRSLKLSGGLVRSRSVLSRAERIERLIEEGKFEEGKNCPLGLPKTKVKHSKAGTKSKKEDKIEETAEAAEAAAEAAEAGSAEK